MTVRLVLLLLLCAVAVSRPAIAQEERRISGLAGYTLGQETHDYPVMGDAKVVESGYPVPHWQYRIRIGHRIGELSALYIRFNPQTRRVYQLYAESTKLVFGDCQKAIEELIDIVSRTFPKHEIDTDENDSGAISNFLVLPKFVGEPEMYGECYNGENRLKLFVTDVLALTAHIRGNRGRLE